MDDQWINPSRVQTDVERLEVLQRAQDQLWMRLRGEDDPDRRMLLLSEFSEIRSAIERVERSLATSFDEPADGTDVGPLAFDQAGNLVASAEPSAGFNQPGDLAGALFARRGDPSTDGLTDDDEVLDEGPPPLEPEAPVVEEPLPADDDGFDLGAAWADSLLGDPPPPGPESDLDPGSDSGPDPDPGFLDEFGRREEEERESVEGDFLAVDDGLEPEPVPVRAGPNPPTREFPALRSTKRRSPSGHDSPPRILLVAGGIVAVLAIAWLVLSRPADDGPTTAAADLTGDTASPAPAGPELDRGVEAVSDGLRQAGLDGVAVERRSGVIFLTGTVPGPDERSRAMDVARAAAPDEPIDASQLTAQAPPPVEEDDAAPSNRSAALQSELARVIAATPLIFEVEQTSITELHARILNSVSSILANYPEQTVTIVGFTDDTGTDESNRQISLRRAESVLDYLVAQGVPAERLLVDAKGEDTSSGSSALANLERRVEFEVTTASSAGPVAPATDAVRIAVVAPSARNDLAFTQSMVDAVEALAAERGNVELAITDDTFVPEEAAAAIRDYAAQGYDLVIAHGSQFGSVVLEIAPEHPETTFAWGTASDTFGLPNVHAYDASADQGGYIQGSMAALLSTSGVVGVVGPIEVGDAERYVEGFRAGALAAQPGIDVRVTYTGSFSDLALAAEAAQGHAEAGADVMTGSAQMVVGAVSVAGERGAAWFGTQANQTSLAPSLVVASQVYHWEVILRDILADIDAGTVAGRSHQANLANGGLVIELNPDYPLPAEVAQRADELIASIASGQLVVPAG